MSVRNHLNRWTHTLPLLLCLIVGLGAAALAEARQTGGTTAFVNVRVISMNPDERSKIKKKQTVIVEDGRIVEIGPVRDVTVPDGAEVIEGRNKLYLLPGLVDMHVHNHDVPLLPEEIAPEDVYSLYLANGITTMFDLGGFDQIFRWKRDIERGRVVGPSLYFTSPLIGEENYTSTAQLESDVRGWVAQGFEYIKSHAVRTPEFFDAIYDLADELNVPVVTHALRPGYPLADTLERQPRMIAHIEEILSTSVTEVADFEGQLEGPIQEVANSRIWVNTTVNTYEVVANTVNDDTFAALLSRPEMAYLPPTVRALWESQNNYRRPEFGGDRDFWLSALDVKLYIARRLAELGALDRMLLGSDATTDGVIPGFSIHDELRLLKKAGLSSWEAILTGTYNPAVFFDQIDEVGTVETGKRADLLVVKKNPLKKLKRLETPVGVMLNGVWLPADELQSRLDELAERWAD